MRLKRILNPWPDAPLPLWMIFPVIFVALYASHFTLLRLPYYWDEAGYYIPAAWDFFRTGSLIPFSTLNNAHPPLPSIYLAFWWKASGFHPAVTREAVLMVAALGLLAVWRLSMRLMGVAPVAFWTVLLTGLYPIWFAQSSLAQADIFAAACTLWGLVYSLPSRDRQPRAAALWFAAAALCKETAIAIPLTLAAICLVEGFRSRASARFRLSAPPAKTSPWGLRLWREPAWLSASVLPLIGWYAYHYAKTGLFFGAPGYVRYNAESTLVPLRILAAFGHRIFDLTAHMNLFVPVLMTFAALLLTPRPDAGGHDRPTIAPAALRRIFWLLLVNAILFSVLGGALLNRYLLPMYPLILLVAVSTFYRRIPYWQGIAAFSAVAFVLALFINPPYGFAPEDNLAYAHIVRMHMEGIAALRRLAPGATVLTAWPMTDELTHPELGYVRRPWNVCRIDNFSAAQIARAARDPENYSAALVFSTKYDPPSPLMRLGLYNQALDERYFGLYHDMTPLAIAAELDGTVVWRRDDDGLWIALLRFNRPTEARTENPEAPASDRR